MPDNSASPLVPVFLKLIEWLVVPLVLVLLWGYGFLQLPEKAQSDEAKTAARHARWAGLIVLVLFIIGRKGTADSLTLEMPEYDFNWWLTMAGTVAGYFSSWLIDWLRHYRALSFVVLVLVASMSISIYCYLFVPDVRTWILFLALGFAFGTLLNKAFGRLGSPGASGEDKSTGGKSEAH